MELQFQYAIGIHQNEEKVSVGATSNAADASMQKVEEQMLEKEYRFLLLQQEGYTGVCKALAGKEFAEERKAIFFQASQQRILNTIDVAREGNENIQEIVANFWRENFEFLAITSRHGVFIFHYVNGDEDRSGHEFRENQAQILSELGNLGKPCITTISMFVVEDQKKPDISQPQMMNYGHHFSIHVAESTIMHDVKFAVKKIAAIMKKRVSKSQKLEAKLQTLAVKLTVLQNFENEVHLVHHKLENQEWGRSGVMLWTNAQRRCIEEGRQAFREQVGPLRLLIRGCQGSGKTLVLMRMAKEFVAAQKEGLFLIQLVPLYHRLKCELLQHISSNDQLAGRVIIGYFHTREGCIIYEDEEKADLGILDRWHVISPDSVGVFCSDEIDRHLLPQALSLLSAHHHVILATSKKDVRNSNPKLLCNREVTLEGNLRSAPPVARLTTQFQTRVSDYTNSNMLVRSSLNFIASPPKVTILNSEDRVEFCDEIVSNIRDSLNECQDAKVTIINYGHRSLVERMKEQLRAEERSRAEFTHYADCLGCQFPIIILAMDLSTMASTSKSVTDGLTRATTHIKCVINASLAPLMIGDQVAFRTIKRQKEEVASVLRELSSSCKKIMVDDYSHLIDPSLQAELEKIPGVDVTRSFQTEFIEQTKDASVVVALVPYKFTSSLHLLSYAPVIELVIIDEKGEDRSRDWDEVLRKPLLRFFLNYSR